MRPGYILFAKLAHLQKWAFSWIPKEILPLFHSLIKEENLWDGHLFARQG